MIVYAESSFENVEYVPTMILAFYNFGMHLIGDQCGNQTQDNVGYNTSISFEDVSFNKIFTLYGQDEETQDQNLSTDESIIALFGIEGAGEVYNAYTNYEAF